MYTNLLFTLKIDILLKSEKDLVSILRIVKNYK